MNPHDPAQHPGAHLVAEEFGVDDPWKLSDDHPLRSPLDLVGKLVAEAARDVDELHGELTRAAQSAIGLLRPIANGAPASVRGWDGVLRTIGPQINLLAARRGAAHEQLTRSIAAFRRLQSKADAYDPVAEMPTSTLGSEQGAANSDDDWAISSARLRRALEAAEAGGLRFHQSAVFGDQWVSNAKASRSDPLIWPDTVQRMIADGLLSQDTSESLYRPGQLLSLTPQGETALRRARATSPRVSAALSRSGTAADVGAAVSAAVTSTGPARAIVKTCGSVDSIQKEWRGCHEPQPASARCHRIYDNVPGGLGLG